MRLCRWGPWLKIYFRIRGVWRWTAASKRLWERPASRKGKTLAVAESCTGGYISSLFTAIAGASEILKVPLYLIPMRQKHSLLKVDSDVFTSVGAVSRECVEQLAKNALKTFKSDYALSISGIAGPTGGNSLKSRLVPFSGSGEAMKRYFCHEIQVRW